MRRTAPAAPRFEDFFMDDDKLYDSLDFHFESTSPLQRGSFRVAVRGLRLHVNDLRQSYPVRDLSAGGCSLNAPARDFALRRILTADLHVGDTPYMEGLTLKTVRHIEENIVACAFQSISLKQEYALDKLLLEMQKRSIAARARGANL